MMKNPKLLYAGISILFFVIMIYVLSPTSTQTYPTLENEEVKKVDSKSEVHKFFNSITPGLKRAESLGIVKHIDKEIQFEGFQRSLVLDKIWYKKDEAYLFYNRDIESVGKTPSHNKDVEVPNIKNISIDPGRTNLDIGISSYGSAPRESVQFEGRFYSRLRFDIHDKEYDKISTINKTVPVNVNLNVDGKSEVFSTSIPVAYQSSQEYIQEIDLNQTFSQDDISLDFNSLEIGSSYNRLYFTSETLPDHDLYNIFMTIQPVNDEKENASYIRSDKQTENPNDYYIEWDPFNEIPDQLSFNLKHATVRGTESVYFQLDFNSYFADHNEERFELGKKVAHRKNTSIIVESLFKQKREENPRLGVYIRHEFDQKEGSLTTVLSTDARPSVSDHPNNPTPIITAYVDENHPLQLAAKGGSSNENAYHILWYLEEQELNSPLHINIDKLAYEVKFNETFNVDLKE